MLFYNFKLQFGDDVVNDPTLLKNWRWVTVGFTTLNI